MGRTRRTGFPGGLTVQRRTKCQSRNHGIRDAYGTHEGRSKASPRDARIGAAESFSAPDDLAAAQVRAIVQECCSDMFEGYEVWRGSKYVARTRKGKKVTLQDVVMARQENILDLEDRLQTRSPA
jgi:hypothetical protein